MTTRQALRRPHARPLINIQETKNMKKGSFKIKKVLCLKVTFKTTLLMTLMINNRKRLGAEESRPRVT
jgi:hypothetical protein